MCKTLPALALAWVLWKQFIPLGGDETKATWDLVNATTLEAVCRQEAARLQSGESRYGIDGDRRYRCFPESLDPRPKR